MDLGRRKGESSKGENTVFQYSRMNIYQLVEPSRPQDRLVNVNGKVVGLFQFLTSKAERANRKRRGCFLLSFQVLVPAFFCSDQCYCSQIIDSCIQNFFAIADI